jgi:hypothetical protein
MSMLLNGYIRKTQAHVTTSNSFPEKDSLLSEKYVVTRSNDFLSFDKKSAAEIITKKTWF